MLDDNSADIFLKSIFTSGMVFIYAITFFTQTFDTATTSAILSSFTNALIGIFAYNWAKRKSKK